MSGPPSSHDEAKEILTEAYEATFGDEVNLFALGIAQAIGLKEGKYGDWEALNNWGAITRKPNSDGSCPADSVKHSDTTSNTGEKYEMCFRVYPSSLDGAKDFLRVLYVTRPAVFEAALAGDIRGVAREMYQSGYYQGFAPATQKDPNGDFTNVNNYISFIGDGVDEIAYLYPSGSANESGSGINPVALAGIGAVAVIALLASKS